MKEEENPRIYLLPNLMTEILLCGFVAVPEIVEGALLQGTDVKMSAQRFELAILFFSLHVFATRWMGGSRGWADTKAHLDGNSILWRILYRSASPRR